MTRRPSIDSIIRAAKKHGAAEVVLPDGTRIRLSGGNQNNAPQNSWDEVLVDGDREAPERH